MQRAPYYAGESALAIDAKALYDAAMKERSTSFQDNRTTRADGCYTDAVEVGLIRAAVRGWSHEVSGEATLRRQIRAGRIELQHDPT
eukprot:4082752-Pyramimonas_sp.AAC.1